MVDAESLLAAIQSLIECHGLKEELIADTTSVAGHLIWERTVGKKRRSIRILTQDPDYQAYGYVVAWHEKDGDELYEGKWLWDFDLTVKAFSRFLIEGEDRRQISKDQVAYLERTTSIPRRTAG